MKGNKVKMHMAVLKGGACIPVSGVRQRRSTGRDYGSQTGRRLPLRLGHMVFRRVDLGPRYSTRIAQCLPAASYPAVATHCTEIPRFPGRGRRVRY